VLALGLVVGAGSARADDALATARKDVDNSDYLPARLALADALAAGTAGPDDLAEIYMLSGIVEGALGDSAAAKRAFAKWLSIDPKGTLPQGTSPKITRPFTAAAASTAPIKVKTETSADPPSVTLVVVSDKQKLITGARVFVRADGGRERELDGEGTKEIAIELPHGHRLDLRVQAVDKHGNRVVELGSSDVPIVITGAAPEPPPPPATTTATATTSSTKIVKRAEPPPTSRPVLLRWWVWGVATVAIGGATAYLGVVTLQTKDHLDTVVANSSDHVFDGDATLLQARLRHEVLALNIGLGVTGALALGTVILFAVRPHAEHRVAIVPSAGGGSVVFGGTF